MAQKRLKARDLVEACLDRIEARDDQELVSEGRHERHLIDAARFNAKVAQKAGMAA